MGSEMCIRDSYLGEKLKYKVKNAGDFEKQLDLKVDFQDLDQYKNEAINKISKNLNIKGFRPGKIPANIVTREVGEDAINEEAIEMYLPENLFTILKDEELNPATRPVIKKIEKKDKNYDIEVLITLWPTLSKLPKLEQEVEVESIKPTDEEMDDQIDRVRTQFAEVSKVERSLDSGDYALINVSAKKNNEELKDFAYSDYLYEVGTNMLTPQLDSKLIGVSPGAIVKLNDTIPQLQIEDAEITVLVKEVREKILPDFTDEWVSDTTEFDDIKNLREELEKNIEMVKKRQVASQYQGELTNKLIEEAKIELPEQLVIAEMDSILQNFINELAQNNIKMEDYFQVTGLTEEALRDDLNKQATRNLTMVVILDKVIEELDIKLEEEDTALIDEHIKTLDSLDEVEITTRRLNLEAESLRNKAMLHVLKSGSSVDKNGEKVYLQDVYNQDTDTREEE